jgi:MarR family transcriptional regulator, organic hydroperoxide resistance regulator
MLKSTSQYSHGANLSPSKNETINRIIRLQVQIQHSLRDEAPDAWLALNLSIAQLKSLFYLDFAGASNSKSLASALHVTPPNITGIIDRLVEQGLVTREDNLLNRRMQILKLTPEGANLVTRLRERTASHFSRLLETLNEKDLAALAQGLDALSRAAGISSAQSPLSFEKPDPDL